MEDFHQTPPPVTGLATTATHESPQAEQGRVVSGTKRTFSDRVSSLPQHDIEEHLQDARPASSVLVDEDSPLGKRQRGVDWPLPSSLPAHDIIPLQHRSNASRSPSYLGMSLKAHTSRFVEGSMRNRRSVQPPSEYTEYGEYLENDGTQRGTIKAVAPLQRSGHQRDDSVAPSDMTDRSDASKHSSIFKFGKSLAASFNPSNWKIRLKMTTVAEDSAQKAALQQQKNDAEKVYQEFKNKGVFQAREILPRSSVISPENKHGLQVAPGQEATFEVHDKTLRQDKRRGRIFSPPLQYQGSLQDVGYVSDDAPSSTRSCFNLKKPATPLLRKQLHLHSSSDQNLIISSSIRRLPSRKDLQKQQKLVKKVSDLETKLEIARRELRDVLGEPLPSQLPRAGRRPFVPGALSSLPSERLLSGFADIEVDTSNIGQAHGQFQDRVLPTSPLIFEREETTESVRNSTGPDVVGRNLDESGPAGVEAADIIIQSVEFEEPEVETKDAPLEADEREKHVLSTTVPTEAGSSSGQLKSQHTKKRKSFDDGRYRPSSESDDDAEWSEPVKHATPKKNSGRPRKIQKTNAEDGKAVEADHPMKSALKTPRTPNKRPQAQTSSKTPCNAQSTNDSIQTSPPPPSSDFAGVKLSGVNRLSSPRLAFPMAAAAATKGTVQIYGNGLRAEPAAEDIPPVPKIPKELRTSTDTKVKVKKVPTNKHDIHSSLGGSEEMKKRVQKSISEEAKTPKAMQTAMSSHESFEWDEDVF